MKTAICGVPLASKTVPSDYSRFVVGWLVAMVDGRPMVDYSGNPDGPFPARFAIAVLPQPGPDWLPVLLCLDSLGEGTPIIVGQIRDTIATTGHVPPDPLQSTEVLVDGRRIILTARQEILLRCGKSSI